MKLKLDERKAERDGSLTEKVFNVKCSPQAFKILADNLYSNKDRAVVRELTCNSHDSHLEKYGDKANEIPIDIHIPNYLEPWFSIRDYGNGMSHEFMMGEIEVNGQKVGYCTAFHSSKSDSNEQSGLYGLGKLAILSVTDSYSITSITHCSKSGGDSGVNMKRFYTVCREMGFPTIIFMGESETNEKTGVEIKAPISNYSSFEKEAIGFLSNLDVNFNISGTTLRPRNLEAVLNRGSWRAFKNDYSSSDGVMAKIGIVRYPISNNHLPAVLQHKSLEIDFPIGSLEITPSRESLSYNEGTIKLIKDRTGEIVREIKEEFNAKLAVASNLWEARKLINSLNSGELSRFSSIITNCTYNGKPVYDTIKAAYGIERYETRSKYRRFGGDSISLCKYPANHISVNDSTVFIIDDSLGNATGTVVKVTYPRLRISKYLKDHPKAYFYMFTQKTYDYIKATGDLDGAPDPIYLSKLPFDPVVRVKGGSKKTFDAGEVYYVSAATGISYNDREKRWTDNSTLPEEAYYIITGKNERSRLCDCDDNWPKKLGFCKDLGIPAHNVFAIHPRKEKSFLKQYPGWKPAKELDEKIKKELDNRLKGVIVENAGQATTNFVKVLTSVKGLHTNKQIAELKKLIDGYDKEKHSELIRIASFYSIEVPESNAIKEAYQKLLQDYPLLQLANGKIDIVSEYKNEWVKYLVV